MSRFRDTGNPDCKIYVGDLASSTSKQDLEDAFAYYGPIRNVWVARNPPGFAFIEFDDARDAEDAVRGADGRRSVNGRRVRVEMCNASRKGGFRGTPSRRTGRPFHPEDRCYECGKRGHYARDCRGRGGRARSYSRSRSRSRDRDRRNRSRSASKSRSRSRGKRSTSRTRARSVSRGKSVSRSRSPSRSRARDAKDRNGDL
ncbi:unnamed protein product [Bemisia tabaci]|uniref:Uncharacterized protein n=1 Tax=Bemisia tabaci TaxID=7038 RepID=A0A9P0F321_BEMTA|nr:PREDICTED: serine/arginine-rich splicing factor 7-like [Bemisia tabaci]CAH0389862.1 unnamed protein product [Bemisia tabaci]